MTPSAAVAKFLVRVMDAALAAPPLPGANVSPSPPEDWRNALLTRCRAMIESQAEPKASSQCPMCGVDTPHAHQRDQVIEWLRIQARRFYPDDPSAIIIESRIGDQPLGYYVQDGIGVETVVPTERDAAIWLNNRLNRGARNHIIPLVPEAKLARAIAANAALRAELDEARADTERLDWLAGEKT